MEDAIGGDLRGQGPKRRGLHAGQQMVPLQDLMQQDAVKKAAHGKSQEQAGPAQAPRGCGVIGSTDDFHADSLVGVDALMQGDPHIACL
ncbi:hypothetical protein D3C72_1999490 [compost metagenome]